MSEVHSRTVTNPLLLLLDPDERLVLANSTIWTLRALRTAMLELKLCSYFIPWRMFGADEHLTHPEAAFQ